jgi:hypothetical protein
VTEGDYSYGPTYDNDNILITPSKPIESKEGLKKVNDVLCVELRKITAAFEIAVLPEYPLNRILWPGIYNHFIEDKSL